MCSFLGNTRMQHFGLSKILMIFFLFSMDALNEIVFFSLFC